MQSSFRVVEAGKFCRDVPGDLLALLVGERDEVGKTVNVCAVGDIGLSGRAAKTAQRQGSDLLFADVSKFFNSADITFGNLESPLAGDLSPGNMFAAPPAGAKTLKDAGFKLIHLANNHVGEYGQTGLAATLKGVQSAGIVPLGAGKDAAASKQMVRTDKDGIRIGWLGCGRTLLSQDSFGEHYWEFNEVELLSEIKKVRPELDVLIVSIHIGMMYLDYPRPDHKSMGERLLAGGADLVLMHHAHVLQGIQLTPQGQVCCFNLGNFLYDWEEGDVLVPVMLQEQNEGAVFYFTLDRLGLARMTVLPTWIDDYCCVRWATGERGQQILERLVRISKDLEGDFAANFERQRATRNMGPMLSVLAFHAKKLDWRYFFGAISRVRLEHFKMLYRWLGNSL